VEQLSSNWAVNYTQQSTGRTWPLEFLIDGKLRSVAMKSRVTVSSANAYFSCCEAGLGLVQVPRYHAARGLRNGTVRAVLPALALPTMPVAALYPHHRQLSPRVRVFVDWLAALFGRWEALG
jgi:LysR family transcriptional regulator, regulator for bpeEF and oprC